MSMKMYSPAFSPANRAQRAPTSPTEALRIYFTILFGVTVTMLAFYYLFP